MTLNHIYSYFVKRHGAFEYRNGWLRIPVCPFCGKEEKFGVRLSTNQTNCFVCGSHGTIYECIRQLEGPTVSIMEVLSWYEGLEYRAPRFKEIEVKPLILPEGYLNISIGESHIGKEARDYLRGRGFNIESLSKLGIGYIVDPESDLYNHIIIPYYQSRTLVYFQARRYKGFGPKYNNPPVEDYGIRKGQIIYNIDHLDQAESVNVFEGVFNALTLGDSSIALGSKSISDWQLSKLLSSKVKSFNLLLDGDAWEKAFDLAFSLIHMKQVRIVLFDSGEDANDIGREATMALLLGSKKLNSFNDIVKYKFYVKDRKREMQKAV